MAATERSAGATETFDVDALMDEIRRYLAAVEAFRREGHEPRWQEAFSPPE